MRKFISLFAIPISWLATNRASNNGRRSSAKSPSIQTERLTLRQPTKQDAKAFHDFLSNAEIGQYTELPTQKSHNKSRRFLKWMINLERRRTGKAWLIYSAKNHTMLGCIRLYKIDPKAQSAFIAFEIHPKHWNKGYALEAVGAVVAHAYSDMKLNRIEAWVVENNNASERVLSKAGFCYEGEQREKVFIHNELRDIRVFSLLARD